MSGTSYGACILHVSPESFVGGPLAFVQTGDAIEVDVPARRIHLHVGEEELNRRRAAWKQPAPRYVRGYGAMFSAHIGQADEGCDFDFPRRQGSDSRAGNPLIAPIGDAEAAMKIGLFDHVEHGNRPLASLFDERLTFAKAADDAGIYCLHVAEHHATPLNMVPVPGVYLGAVARATTRMRLGPLVYLLPLYSPLRLIEEICILDHLSHGRMEVGIGRGVSPFELKYHRSTTRNRARSSSMRSIASARA